MPSPQSLLSPGPGPITTGARASSRSILQAVAAYDLPPILTLKEVAQVLRCSKAHVANVINGHVKGLPRLTYFSLGRRKLVRREWLDQWMEANKVQC